MWELNTNIIEYLPDWFKQIADFQKICETESEQFESLAEAIHAVADNFFFQTMDEGAVAMWEQIYGIIPNPSLETLAFRRMRVLNRLSTKPPFTLGFLYQKLDELIGVGQWTVSIDYANYTLYVESSAKNQQYATEVEYTIGKIKPAHIVYVNTPYLKSGIFMSEAIELAKRAYNYRLGTWGLGILPFASENSQGVIKMPTVSSIQDSLLMATANFVSGDIQQARINQSISITSLTKSVEDSTLTVTYMVEPSQTTAINQVELLDANNNVLTSSIVYVPVSSPVVVKHVLPIEEGA